jgi:exodeoxyribonuclease-3
MRVITYNVNGIRALGRKRGLARLAELEPDVVCLQEVRADPTQLAEVMAGHGRICRAGVKTGLAESELEEVVGEPLFDATAFAPASQKGRNGVAILAGASLSGRQAGLPGFEDEGRWVEAFVNLPSGPIRIVSVYVPKGYVGDPRQERKMEFLTRMTERMSEFGNEASSGGPDTLVCGDLNVAHRDNDLKNWKGRRGHSGVLPQERALAGDPVGPYTWWSQRGRAFDNDAGWRIDYIWATQGFSLQPSAAQVDRPPSWNSRWSDHAALLMDFE